MQLQEKVGRSSMANQEQIEHLGDHLPYEVLMLRLTHKRMNEDRYPLDWNAYYEAFAVHARVLFDFLMNEPDSRNFKASNFVKFTAEKDKEIQRIVRQESNTQVFHFGKHRSSEPSKKVHLEKVNRVHKWVMDNFSRFTSELDGDLKEHWYPDRADPDKFYEAYQKKMSEVTELFLEKQGPTTSTGHAQMVGSSNRPRKR